MRKLFLACLMFAGMQIVSAQEATWVPKNLGVGVGVGTTGIVIDASTTIHNYFGVRFGVDIMPKIKINTEFDLGLNGYQSDWNKLSQEAQKAGIDLSGFGNQLPKDLKVQGKLNNTTWHFLIDVYPFGAKSSFHATVGAYFGSKKVISIYNRSNELSVINEWNEMVRTGKIPGFNENDMIGAQVGEYFITPDPKDNGNVEGRIEVAGFRPYLGLGFGRAVPKKRVGCQFDMGVQFWGSPEVIAPQYDKENKVYKEGKLEKSKVDGSAGGFIKTISKVSVYPVLNFRLVGRIL